MMRYLIDTNILLFYINDPEEISLNVRGILEDYGNRIYVPAKCVEELIYLRQSGKVEYRRWKSAEDILRTVGELDIGIKHTGDEHLLTLARLPLFPDHKDQTDRVIVAQAITEKTPLISSDRKFVNYERYGLDFVFNKR